MKPRTILVYGESGDTKTSQLYHLAKYIIKSTGRKVRLISADGGGYAPFEDPSPDPFFRGESLISSGWVDVFDITHRKLALADLRRLSEGYWPRDSKKYGLKGYFKSDDTCLTKDEEWEGIGGYIVEGITSVATNLLDHISQQDEGVGFKHSWQYEEDGYKVGGLQEGHYGIVQNELRKLIKHGFNFLPCRYVLWSALIAKATEKRTGTTIYGPKSAGDATTYEIPSWFMDVLHLSTERIDKDDKVVVSKVAWFQQHDDKESGIPYLCKARVIPELYPKLLEEFPGGFVKLGFKVGLDKYLRFMDRIKKEISVQGKDKDKDKGEKENVSIEGKPTEAN